MSIGIGFVDGIAACLFLAAAVIAVVTNRLAAQRTHLWAYMTLVFGLFALERGMNAAEWAGGERFAWLDAVDGYLNVVACLILAGLAISFWAMVRRVSPPEAP